jgi:hypothetical protein
MLVEFHLAKGEFPPVIPLDLAGASWNGSYGMSFTREAAALPANSWLEPGRYQNPFLRFQYDTTIKLMRKVLSTRGFITRTHHHRVARCATVLADELELVKAGRDLVIAGHVATFYERRHS